MSANDFDDVLKTKGDHMNKQIVFELAWEAWCARCDATPNSDRDSLRGPEREAIQSFEDIELRGTPEKPFAPYWPDACEHKANEFAGTVIEADRPVDVYVFRNGSDPWLSTCVRHGSRPEDYRSGEGRYFMDRPKKDWTASHYLLASRFAELGVG